MAFLRNNVNTILLFLIVLIIASFTSFTIYYNNKYENLTKQYDQTYDQLRQVTEEKALREIQLNNTLTEYESKINREQDLTYKYSGIRDVNQNLSNELNQKIVEILSVRTDLATKKAQLAQANDDISAKAKVISDLNADLTSANSRITQLKRDLNSCQDQLAASGS